MNAASLHILPSCLYTAWWRRTRRFGLGMNSLHDSNNVTNMPLLPLCCRGYFLNAHELLFPSHTTSCDIVAFPSYSACSFVFLYPPPDDISPLFHAATDRTFALAALLNSGWLRAGAVKFSSVCRARGACCLPAAANDGRTPSFNISFSLSCQALQRVVNTSRLGSL